MSPHPDRVTRFVLNKWNAAAMEVKACFQLLKAGLAKQAEPCAVREGLRLVRRRVREMSDRLGRWFELSHETTGPRDLTLVAGALPVGRLCPFLANPLVQVINRSKHMLLDALARLPQAIGEGPVAAERVRRECAVLAYGLAMYVEDALTHSQSAFERRLQPQSARRDVDRASAPVRTTSELWTARGTLILPVFRESAVA